MDDAEESGESGAGETDARAMVVSVTKKCRHVGERAAANNVEIACTPTNSS